MEETDASNETVTLSLELYATVEKALEILRETKTMTAATKQRIFGLEQVAEWLFAVRDLLKPQESTKNLIDLVSQVNEALQSFQATSKKLDSFVGALEEKSIDQGLIAETRAQLRGIELHGELEALVKQVAADQVLLGSAIQQNLKTSTENILQPGMSTMTLVQKPEETTFRARYELIDSRIEIMVAQSAETSTLKDTYMFLHTIMMRLGRWAAHVEIEKDSLEWVASIETVGTPLRHMLHHLSHSLDSFRSTFNELLSQKISKDETKSKIAGPTDALRKAVDDIVSFGWVINSLNTMPKIAQTPARALQTNQNASERTLSKEFITLYFMLQHPHWICMTGRLLGGFCLDIRDPMSTLQENKKDTQVPTPWVSERLLSEFDPITQWVRLKSVDVPSDFAARISLAAAGVTSERSRTALSTALSYKTASTYRSGGRTAEVVERTIKEVKAYLDWSVRRSSPRDLVM